jgi:hypothetical protein
MPSFALAKKRHEIQATASNSYINRTVPKGKIPAPLARPRKDKQNDRKEGAPEQDRMDSWP